MSWDIHCVKTLHKNLSLIYLLHVKNESDTFSRYLWICIAQIIMHGLIGWYEIELNHFRWPPLTVHPLKTRSRNGRIFWKVSKPNNFLRISRRSRIFAASFKHHCLTYLVLCPRANLAPISDRDVGRNHLAGYRQTILQFQVKVSSSVYRKFLSSTTNINIITRTTKEKTFCRNE